MAKCKALTGSAVKGLTRHIVFETTAALTSNCTTETYIVTNLHNSRCCFQRQQSDTSLDRLPDALPSTVLVLLCRAWNAASVITLTREGDNYSDVLPLKARPTRQHFQLNILWGFESELQTNQIPFYLESLWGATIMPIRGCAMDCDGTK